jgi:hypothetical protein
MPMFPSRMLFRPVVLCPRLEPAPSVDGDLADWDVVPPLPPLEELDAEKTVAEVFVGWREDGVYVAARFPKPHGPVVVSRQRPHSGDGLQVWVDTRATQDAHRATRFCHHFILLPRGGGPGRDQAVAWQANIRRARERSPLADPSDLTVAARAGGGIWTLEAHLPARALNGFEGRAGTRLGFTFLAHDVPGGRQFWTAPRDLPVETDPSLWGTLELVDRL